MRSEFFINLILLLLCNMPLTAIGAEDLTPEDISRIKDMYGGYADLVDGVRIEKENEAFLELYGDIRRLSSGLCVRSKVVRRATIVDGIIDIKPFNYPPPVTELLVWVPTEGKELDCSVVENTDGIKVNVPLEQNTLLRLHEQGKSLLSKAAALDKRLQIKKYISDSRIDSIGINLVSFSYNISFMVDQCHGFSLDIVTNEAGSFDPVNIVPIVC